MSNLLYPESSRDRDMSEEGEDDRNRELQELVTKSNARFQSETSTPPIVRGREPEMEGE